MNKMIILLLLGCKNINNKYKVHELHTASNEGNIKIIEELLKKGADINEKDKYCRTALMFAANSGNKEVVELLLEKRANINEKNNDGYTALICAADSGNKEVVELLLEKGANVNEKNNDGYTALMRAAYNGHKEVVELLLEKGANVDEKNEYGDTALILEASIGNKEILKLLLEKGANVNEKNKYGYTALIYAARSCNEEVVELLLNNYADIGIKNNYGDTAIDIAKKVDNYEALFSIFKKVTIYRIDDTLQTWNRALQLLAYFKTEDADSIYILDKAIDKMIVYYTRLDEYDLSQLELAIFRLRKPVKLSEELNYKYKQLLKAILLYIARASEKNIIDAMKEEQIELLKQIAYGLSVITEKVNGKYVIKQDLPEDIFNVITTYF